MEEKITIINGVSLACMLPQVILWTLYTIYAWKTPLKLLKLLSVLFVIMNLCWIISMVMLYLDLKDRNWSLQKENYWYPFWAGFFGAVYLDLFAASHWIFTMNYFVLAKTIEDEKNANKLWIKVVYYGVLSVIVLLPVIALAVQPKNNIILSGGFIIALLFISLLTPAFLLWALQIIKKNVECDGKKTINYLSLSLHFVLITIFTFVHLDLGVVQMKLTLQFHKEKQWTISEVRYLFWTYVTCIVLNTVIGCLVLYIFIKITKRSLRMLQNESNRLSLNEISVVEASTSAVSIQES